MVSSDEHWNPMSKPSRRDLMRRAEEAANEDEPNKTEMEGIVEGAEEPNGEEPIGPELDHNPFEGGEDQTNHQDDSVNLSSSDSPGTSPVQETTKGLTNDEEMANDYDDNEFYAGLKKEEEEEEVAAEEQQDDPFYSELTKKEEEPQDDPFYSELNKKEAVEQSETQDDPFYSEINKKEAVEQKSETQDDPFYSELNEKVEENGINGDNQVQVTEPEAVERVQLEDRDAAEESFFEKLSDECEEESKPREQSRKKTVRHSRVPSVFANSADDDFFSKELSGEQADSGMEKKSKHTRVPSVFANSEDDDFFSKQLSETIPEAAEDEESAKEELVAPLSQGNKDKQKSFHTRVPSAFVRRENEDDFFSSLAEEQQATIEEEPQPATIQENPPATIAETEPQGQQQTAGTDAFGFLADDDDDLLTEDPEPKTEQETLHKQESSKDLSASLAFLEQDDDLLPEDDEEADDNKPLAEVKQTASLKQYTDSYFASKTPNMPSGGFSQSNYTTPYTPYQQQQPQQQPHHLQKTKSFVTETANNSFDLPTGMVPKQSIRRVTSFQQPPTNVYSTPSTGLTPAQQPPGSAKAGGPPKSNKPFFDELPLPPPKKPHPPRRNMSQEGMQHPPAAPPTQGPPSVTSPPLGGPPRNVYAPPPSNYPSQHGHSRSSSGDASSVRSTSPLNYRPPVNTAQTAQPAQVPQVPLAPPMEYVPPPQSSSSVSQPRSNPYAPTPNQQPPQAAPSSSSAYAPQKSSPGNYAPSSYQPAKTATPPPPPSSSASNTSSPSRNPYDPHNQQRSPRQQQVSRPPQSGYHPSPPAGAAAGVPPPPPPPSTGYPGGQRKPPLSTASSLGDLPEGLGSRPVISPRGSIADGMPERSASRSRNVQPLVPPPATHQATPGAPPPASLNLERSRQHSEATPRQYAKPTLPQTVAHGGTTVAPDPPVDNEALARRQFPAFRWGVGKKSAAVIPPAIAFGGSNTQIRVVNASDVVLDNEHLTKFPRQIMGLKGPVKSKKKELEKWCAEKVNKLQSDMEGRETYSARNEHKVVLWRILQILLKSEGSITKAIQENLQEIRTILHPGVQPLVSQDENAFSKASDMYNSAMNMPKPHANPNDPYSVASFGPDELKSIMGEIEVGDREGALRNAIEKRLWAHALIIAGSLDADHWHRTVMEFVRSEVKANATPSAKNLAFMYRVFSGAGGDSVSELYPTQRAQQVSDDGSLDKTLNDWGVHLSLIISNASPKNTEAILSLGKELLKYGYVEAAHVCLLLSGCNTFFGNGDMELPGAMLLGADSMYGNCGLGRDADAILASELYEFIFFNNPPPEVGSSITHFPHLLLYKVIHAEMLADHGAFGEAQKVCENVAMFIKNAPKGTRFNRVFLERLEHVNARINSIDESASSSGWFGGKLGRPKLDKIWMQSFNKFVAGDDEDVASEASSTDKEGAIFKKLASTPSVSRVESATDLSGQYFSGGAHTPEYGYSQGAADSRAVSNPYAPGDRPGSLHRIQSYAGLPSASMGSQYGGLGIQPTSSPVYGPSATNRRNNFGQEMGGSRPVSPNASIARPSSVGGYEEHAPPPPRPGSAGSSGMSKAPAAVPPPSPQRAGLKAPMSRAYTPENVADQDNSSAQASPASSLASTSPRRQPPPPRGYNPYAPQAAATQQNGSVRPSSATSNYNPYAPVAPKQQQPEPPVESEDYGASVDNPYGAIYGGAAATAPPPPPPPASAPEPIEESAKLEEEEQPEPEDTYEPPSYGYQPPPLEEEEVPDAEGGGGNFFVPVAGAAAAPIPKAPIPVTGHYTPPTAEPIPEENEEVEDLGIGNAKSETERMFEEAKRKQDEEDERKRQEQENKKSGKWFSWLRKGEDQQQSKAIRAKLGEENSFYYDEKLKRWVNKKAPVEEQKAAAPPPPPKASKTPSTTSTPTGFESSPNPSTGGTPPSGGPPPARPSTGPPKPSTGGGLDDLLAAAPTSGTKKHARRSARNRYVDIMQK